MSKVSPIIPIPFSLSLREPQVSRLLVMMLLLVFGGAGSLQAQDASANAARIEGAKTALEKWVETERLISQEQRDLSLARDMLQERIEIVQGEIDELQGKMAQAQQSIDEADARRSQLDAENAELLQASESLTEIIDRIERRTVDLVAALPDPIADRVKPLSQRLPAPRASVQSLEAVPDEPDHSASPDSPAADSPSTDTAESRPGAISAGFDSSQLSLSERFQSVVGILNEVNKFNGEITVTSEVRQLPNGKAAEVTAVYLGIGQGYYVGASGALAGVGTVLDGRWTWKPANELADSIRQLVAILKNEQVAAYVPLPVQIQ